MKKLDNLDYHGLIKHAQILERDHEGGKVFLTPENKIIKLFRHKSTVSSNALNPYFKRFTKNAQRLKSMGISSVNVSETFFLIAQSRYAVIYPRLPGRTLREALHANPTDFRPMEHLASYIAKLHNQGIYFRSLHFGNVLFQQSGQYALIDVVDIKFKKNLNIWHRLKNFKHLCRYQQDIEHIHSFGDEKLLTHYLQSSHLCDFSKYFLGKRLKCLFQA